MFKKILNNVAKLRLAVGLLGEAHQKAWWSSNFFAPNSKAFLTPVYGKTQLLAKYYGVKEAATRVHDDHIGIGKGVYHLFRLPEVIEIDLHKLLTNQIDAENAELILSTPEEAEAYLLDSENKFDISETGPLWMDYSASIKNHSSWQKIANLYLTAFSNGTRVFPYFSGII